MSLAAFYSAVGALYANSDAWVSGVEHHAARWKEGL